MESRSSASEAPPARSTEDALLRSSPVPGSLVDRLLEGLERRHAGRRKTDETCSVPAPTGAAPDSAPTPFAPPPPKSVADVGISVGRLQALALKVMLTRGTTAGREIADCLKLRFSVVEELLQGLKQEQSVAYVREGRLGDLLYDLAPKGREKAQALHDVSAYAGPAPVPVREYLDSVSRQSLSREKVGLPELRTALADLELDPRLLNRLGPALTAGRALFLCGAPGNGKTSIAERLVSAFGSTVWIPRAVDVDGEIVRLFDPLQHREVAREPSDPQPVADGRWVQIHRPTIVVGGELTLDHLELRHDRASGVLEAPVQWKSNLGALVVDDFGRQRVESTDLLNRWIVPLEKRCDFLKLPGGKTLQLPFDQLLVLSTNLSPADLVDEAFLRRIPYKLEVPDPTEAQFRDLLERYAGSIGVQFDPVVLDHLLDVHYRPTGRPLRFCHPRDLLLQVRNLCDFLGTERRMTKEFVDEAAANYFGLAARGA